MHEWDYYEKIPEYHPMADANNLYDAFRKARKGSHWKAQVQRYRWNALSETRKLQNELDAYVNKKDGAYGLSSYSTFEVNERGKRRAITALCMRDRVVKHVLNDVFLLPHIRPHLIYDNGASLEGKGVSFTRNRLIAHLEKYYREYGTNEGYILMVDFSSYYDNIDHAEAMKMICKYENDEVARRLVWQAYDSYKVDVSYMNDEEYENAKASKHNTVEYRRARHTRRDLQGEKFLHKSLSVGDQTSQITAISFPTPIDYLAKIVKGFKYYARYMDDIYVIARTKEELVDLRNAIYAEARKLKIFINMRKTKIQSIKKSFKFMQFKYYLNSRGYVVVRINPKTITRMRIKIKKLARFYRKGEIRFCKIQGLFQSWIANYSKHMSNLQRNHMVELYRSLFGGGLDVWMREQNIA